MPSNHAVHMRARIWNAFIFIWFYFHFLLFFVCCRCCFLLTWQRTLCMWFVWLLPHPYLDSSKMANKRSDEVRWRSERKFGIEKAIRWCGHKCGLDCFYVWRCHCIWAVNRLNDERNVAGFDDEIYVRSSHKKRTAKAEAAMMRWEAGAVRMLFAGSVCVMALQIR